MEGSSKQGNELSGYRMGRGDFVDGFFCMEFSYLGRPVHYSIYISRKKIFSEYLEF